MSADFTARARALQSAAHLERLRGKKRSSAELWTRIGLFVAAIFRRKAADDLTEAEWAEVKQRLDALSERVR
jgi:hypothetical protein